MGINIVALVSVAEYKERIRDWRLNEKPLRVAKPKGAFVL